MSTPPTDRAFADADPPRLSDYLSGYDTGHDDATRTAVAAIAGRDMAALLRDPEVGELLRDTLVTFARGFTAGVRHAMERGLARPAD